MKNVYIFVNNDQVTLIDPGFPTPLLSVKKALGSIGKKLSDVKTILCTHYHFDHVGIVKKIVEESGAKVYAHALDIPYITGERAHDLSNMKPWRRIVFRFLLSLPKPWYLEAVFALQEGGAVPGLPGYRVVHTPGHTPGSVSFYNEYNSVIFTGDAIQPRPCEFTMDPKQEKRSMEMIEKLGASIILPSDGKPEIHA